MTDEPSTHEQPIEHEDRGQLTAVLYLRVSTKEQAHRGGEIEGYSLPAQREACIRKAEALGATVVADFVERGETGRTMRRPELQRMLDYAKSERPAYVIVHKLDRLSRETLDHAMIYDYLKRSKVRLVSCTEPIDDTANGELMFGIFSSLSKYYSRNLGDEVLKGTVQKAKNGGTPFKPPLGYQPVRTLVDGYEVRTVALDPDRAPLVAWAFEAYATGEWTQLALLDELTKRGLDIPGTRKTPRRPLALSTINPLLSNPYYKGIVRYRGVEYNGRHEPLVNSEIWERVQEVIHMRQELREKQREHPHYLKGILCGHCGSRMIVTNAKSRSGRIYPYFTCIGRHQKRTTCQLKAVRIEIVEELVEQLYRSIELPDEIRKDTERHLNEQLAELYADRRAKHASYDKQRKRLLNEQDKLMQAHYAEAIPLDVLKREQTRIANALAKHENEMAHDRDHQQLIEVNLTQALNLASDCYAAYVSAPPAIRRLFNKAFFAAIYIEDENGATADLASPFNLLLAEEISTHDNAPGWKPEGAGLKHETLVGAAGIEPATSRV